MKSKLRSRIWLAVLTCVLICSPIGASGPPADSITVVASHQAGKSKAEVLAQGGLSMYVKVNGRVVLFDTGAKESPLMASLEELGLDPTQIEAIVLSNSQTDSLHGELSDVLSVAPPTAKIYVPGSAAEAVSLENPGANVVPVSKPTRVLPDAWLVGPIPVEFEGETSTAQALVIDRPDGLVVIVGCTNPAVATIVQQVKEVFGHRRIKLIASGVHLRGTKRNGIREVSLKMQQMGIKGLALSECTGEPALKVFHDEWGDRVASFDSGKTVEF